jgi:hypothetical protein
MSVRCTARSVVEVVQVTLGKIIRAADAESPGGRKSWLD